MVASVAARRFTDNLRDKGVGRAAIGNQVRNVTVERATPTSVRHHWCGAITRSAVQANFASLASRTAALLRAASSDNEGRNMKARKGACWGDVHVHSNSRSYR